MATQDKKPVPSSKNPQPSRPQREPTDSEINARALEGEPAFEDEDTEHCTENPAPHRGAKSKPSANERSDRAQPNKPSEKPSSDRLAREDIHP